MKDVKTLLLLTSLLVATLAYGQSAKSSAVGDNTWVRPGAGNRGGNNFTEWQIRDRSRRGRVQREPTCRCHWASAARKNSGHRLLGVRKSSFECVVGGRLELVCRGALQSARL